MRFVLPGLLFALLLAACGAPPRAALLIPTATRTRAPASPTRAPTPNHAWIDAPILDDLPVSAPASPTPLPVRHGVARIVIATIGLDRPLLPVGLDEQAMPIVPKHDPAWFINSAVPGQGDNVVLWGHALRFKDSPDTPAPFGRLNELRPGAQIVLYDTLGVGYAYAVTRQLWVTPDQVGYILPTGREQVTLVSCIGDKVLSPDGVVVNMTHRLITIAEPGRGVKG